MDGRKNHLLVGRRHGPSLLPCTYFILNDARNALRLQPEDEPRRNGGGGPAEMPLLDGVTGLLPPGLKVREQRTVGGVRDELPERAWASLTVSLYKQGQHGRGCTGCQSPSAASSRKGEARRETAPPLPASGWSGGSSRWCSRGRGTNLLHVSSLRNSNISIRRTTRAVCWVACPGSARWCGSFCFLQGDTCTAA